MLSFYFFKCSAYDLHQTVPVSFSNKQQMSSCVLLEEQWHSPFNRDMDNIFVQCSADGGLKNMSVSQCERPLVSEKHVTRGYFVTSGTITHFAL